MRKKPDNRGLTRLELCIAILILAVICGVLASYAVKYVTKTRAESNLPRARGLYNASQSVLSELYASQEDIDICYGAQENQTGDKTRQTLLDRVTKLAGVEGPGEKGQDFVVLWGFADYYPGILPDGTILLQKDRWYTEENKKVGREAYKLDYFIYYNREESPYVYTYYKDQWTITHVDDFKMDWTSNRKFYLPDFVKEDLDAQGSKHYWTVKLTGTGASNGSSGIEIFDHPAEERIMG
ncbi:MAG: hypothetical protein K6G62_05995 [Eubacterium sp.]|nr:hypothetical protein [Eubacterium sp.]